MSMAAALTLLDGIAGDPAVRDVSVRTQVGFVRALVDEIARGRRVDEEAAALLDQLDEELRRLEQMVGERQSLPPTSGVRSCAVERDGGRAGSSFAARHG